MRRRTWGWVTAGAVVVAVAALVIGVMTWSGGGGTVNTATLREWPVGARPAAPPIAGPLLEGDGDLDVAELRGNVVVVNVWGSWCGPCRAETQDLEQVYQETRELGVSFVGINIRDRDRDRAIQFTRGRMSYPSIYDPGFANGLGFHEPPAPLGPPATLVIDRDGNVAAAFYRVVGKVELAHLVKQVAAEEAPPDG
ncbi:MAG TPA: TlpA disulfide reductase family protein [Natronosporangium sp.]|nr:TlpA disulfide reductase family protein [Natronosporangium sp.]